MKSIYGLVWRSLKASRSRTLLSVLAVTIGVASTIATSIVGQSMRRGLLKTDELVTVMRGLLDMIDPFLSFIGATIMVAAAFLIYNAFAMSVTFRQQQIGTLRTLGMGRNQIWRLLIAEALIIGVAGTILGLLAGPFLGLGMVSGARFLLTVFIPLEEAPPLLSDVVLALSIGILLTLAAMLIPARRAMRVTPLDALKTQEAERTGRGAARRARLGLVLIVGLFGYLLIATPGNWTNAPLDFLLAALFVLVWVVALTLMLTAVIGAVGRRGRPLISRFSPAIGRMVTDNLQRARGRVTLTVFTLALALLMLIGLTGLIDFFFIDLMHASFGGMVERQVFYTGRVDIAQGWVTILGQNLDSLMMSEDELNGIRQVTEGRAAAAPMYFIISPELSFMGNAYFSVATDPHSVRQLGASMFDFVEGSWETALPLMESGCALFVTPIVAAKNSVGTGDVLTVTHSRGATRCTVAGIGRSAAAISTISSPTPGAFTDGGPLMAFIMPNAGVDAAQLRDELRAAVPGLRANSFSLYLDAFDQMRPVMTVMFDAMLLLAMLTASMGVVNTIMIGVVERRRELALLRAVGATRRQVRAVIIGEAALIGLIGGGVGLIGGLGFTMIFVVTYGGNSWGLTLDPWVSALRSTQASLMVGLVGLAAAPLVAMAAAWLPARRILRDNPIEALALE